MKAFWRSVVATMPKSATRKAKILRALIQLVGALHAWLLSKEGLPTWRCVDGRVMFIHEMGTEHLANSALLMTRREALSASDVAKLEVFRSTLMDRIDDVEEDKTCSSRARRRTLGKLERALTCVELKLLSRGGAR